MCLALLAFKTAIFKGKWSSGICLIVVSGEDDGEGEEGEDESDVSEESEFEESSAEVSMVSEPEVGLPRAAVGDPGDSEDAGGLREPPAIGKSGAAAVGACEDEVGVDEINAADEGCATDEKDGDEIELLVFVSIVCVNEGKSRV